MIIRNPLTGSPMYDTERGMIVPAPQRFVPPSTDDPNAAVEGRSNMREVTRAEFYRHRSEHPEGDWCISGPLEDREMRFYVQNSVDLVDE